MSITPYMSLTLPTPTATPGPDWAIDINDAFDVVDSHDHTPGKGLPITTAALSIDADLNFQTHSVINIESVQLELLSAALPATAQQAVYSINGDLWYNNQSGTPVQITSGTSVVTPPSPGLPTGTFVPYAGTSAPSGFLLCDGTAVSRTGFAPLFAIIGTNFGPGDGSTTFNVPFMNGNVPMGAGTYTDPTLGSITRTVGQQLGEASHVQSVLEMPSHNHGGGAHTHQESQHTIKVDSVSNVGYSDRWFEGAGTAHFAFNTAAGVTTTSGPNSTVIASQGAGNPANVVQPSLVCTYIIKT